MKKDCLKCINKDEIVEDNNCVWCFKADNTVPRDWAKDCPYYHTKKGGKL